jgi:hypothetical protein
LTLPKLAPVCLDSFARGFLLLTVVLQATNPPAYAQESDECSHSPEIANKATADAERAVPDGPVLVFVPQSSKLFWCNQIFVSILLT